MTNCSPCDTRVAQKKSKKIFNKSAKKRGFAALAPPAGSCGILLADVSDGRVCPQLRRTQCDDRSAGGRRKLRIGVDPSDKMLASGTHASSVAKGVQ
jgi:hypothetical protein